MKALTHWFFAVAFLTVATAYSQGIVTGTVFDAETNTPLPGTNVAIKGTTHGTSTDFDGRFSLSTDQNKGTLVISYVGFMKSEVPFVISDSKANVRVFLKPDAQALGEVVVTGSALFDIAKERQTPVAVSTIKSAEIIEKLGNQEFPEILNRTPSVYATKSGGGYGDSKINIRGFSNENIAVMVNGMPVNDMETYRVYWSNWSGISDVTSATQVQRGLGASKLAIASVGGTINIVTRSSDMKEGGVFSGSIGNDNYTKTMFAYNTGKAENGLSASILLSRAAGSTYVDGTNFEGYNYFFALGYAPSQKHNFQFMITGAPQWHYQRSYSPSITQFLQYGSNGKPNRKYNSDWGYLNGEEYGTRRNVYHKPVMMLNWDWTISDNSALSTVVYASTGRGFGTNMAGRVGGKGITGFRNAATGLYDFDAVVKANQNSNADKGVLVRDASVNSHDWYGILSNFNHKLSDKLTFNVGIDGRYYYGYHYKVLSDLLGATSYKDTFNKNLTSPNYVDWSISDRPNFNPFGTNIEPIERRITYSNDGEVHWLGTFGQLEYASEKISAFVQGSLSNQSYQRIDEFLKPGTLAVASNPDTAMDRKTGFKNILGYNVKTGINYNINEKHNVYANIGYYSKQPAFNSVYPNNRNFLNPNLTNEKIFGIEAGYGFKTENFNFIVNGYRTSWADRYLRRSYNITTNAGERINAYANILGITEVHQGIEVEGEYNVNNYLKLRGSFSLGDWYYKGNASGNLFNENNEIIDNQGNPVVAGTDATRTLYLDGIKVGDAAQHTASVGIVVTPIKGLKFDADWRYVNDLYANIRIDGLDDQTIAKKGTLLLPSYDLFDIGVSYKLPLVKKQIMTFSLNVNNLLDTYYIAESYSNIHAKTLEDFSGNTAQFEAYKANNLYKGIDKSNNVYFGFGRTWNFSIRYSF